MELKSIDLDLVLEQLEYLRPLDATITKILHLLDEPDASASDIAEIILLDTALTANILKVVNSAYFGLKNKVTNIQHAVSLLGKGNIRNIIYTLKLKPLLSKNLQNYPSLQNWLWMHSLIAAIAGEEIAQKIEYPQKEICYLIGLLHDIGKLILNQFMAPYLIDTISRLLDGETLEKIEKDLLGYDHAEIGGLVAEKWNFGEELIEPIKYHHKPELAKTHPLETFIAYLSNCVAALLCPVVFEFHRPYYYLKLLQQFGLSVDDFKEIMQTVLEKGKLLRDELD